MKTQPLDLLLALYIAAIIISELMGSKIFTVAGINASVAILLLPITFSINDIVSEVYGKKRAESFVQAGFAMLILLLGFNVLALALPPATRFMPSNPAYSEVFGTSLRIIVSSLTSFWLSERLDVVLFSRLRQKFGKHKLWLRNNVSNIISQFFDTSLFMFLAFYHPGNSSFMVSLIWPYWLLKCAMSVIETPFTYLGVRWLRTAKEE